MKTFDYSKRLWTNKKSIIFLHGIGSNKQDLFWFQDNFPEYNIFSLNGNYALGENRFARYHLHFVQTERKYNSQEVYASWEYILNFLEYIHQTYHVEYSDMILFGFSQWAILSHYLFATAPKYIFTIVALSGRYIPETGTLSLENNIGRRIFIWHWVQDAVLGIESVPELKHHYAQWNIFPETHTYDMGHTIIWEEIDDIIEFLKV